MNREDLEHIIRAAGEVTGEYEFIIVGSQAILGPVPYPPDVFKFSAEADIYPRGAEDKSELIEGALGEGSQFHTTMATARKASIRRQPNGRWTAGNSCSLECAEFLRHTSSGHGPCTS